MDKFCFLAVLAGLINFVCGELKIIDLKVPSTIEYGTNDEVILDCDYEVKDEKGLVVKWFFDHDDEQIYQWIPNTSKPQALGLLADRIDLEYKASNDTNTMYRALRIKDVTPDLSGFYTCKVASYYSEDIATKKMTIYEPAKTFELEHDPESNTVNCTATGIYPQPKMNVYISTINGTTEDDDDNNEIDNDLDDNGIVDVEEQDSTEDDMDFILENDDKTFNVSSSFSYENEKLDEYTVFVCKMWIPQTTYKLRKTITFYTGTSTTVETQIESDYDYDYLTNATQQEHSSASNLMLSNFLMAAMMAVLVPRI